jgi:uncharacterized membrane protein
MNKGRLEAFSDGVIAIILTIMVLELKVPHQPTLVALRPLAPVFLSYVISFIVIGIYWNNHHHLFQAVQYINGRVMWANLHLLFWLSLVPFVTAWTGENNFVAVPVALHGTVFLLVGVSYYILTQTLVAHHGRDSNLVRSSYGIVEKYRSIDCRYRRTDRFCQSKSFDNPISQTSVNYTKEIS